MCGRYTLTTPLDQILDLFRLQTAPDLGPRYNLAPTQEALVVRVTEDNRRGEALKWGLIPHWAKDPAIASRLINARSETVATKPSFRDAFARRRCLVATDGFIEWKAEQGGKQPYHIVMEDRRPFAFAGIWERWQPPTGDAVETFSILTTTPNETVARLHDRMPVVVAERDFDLWLDRRARAEDVEGLLAPWEETPMEAYPVSRKVNDVANDGPEALKPVAEQQTLFS